MTALAADAGAGRRVRAAIDQAGDPAAAAAHIAASMFFGYALWRAAHAPWAIAPVALLCFCSLVPMAFALVPTLRPRGVWPLTAVALACGAVWTAALILWFPAGDFALQLAVSVAAGGGALALAYAFHVHLPSSLAAIAAPVPAAAALVYLDGAAGSPAPALLLFIYWLLLIWLAVQLGGSARARLELQAEREQLIEKVAAKARELEAAQRAEAAARREAELANAAKSRFLAQSSHDLRQPLHAMGLVLETLPTVSEDPEVGGVVDKVKQSVEMLAQLFDSLLDLTMLDTGQIEIRPVPFSAESLLRQVQADFASIAEASGVEVRVAPTRLWLESDPVVVRRIIQNLVSNAIRHSGRGAVLIGARRVGGAAAIDVVDNGAGIAAADQARIFEEFTTLRPGREAGAATGVGLGLAIVQRMAAALGLSVAVASELGRGSRFRLAGIALAGAAPSQPESPDRPAAAEARTGRIAVFDDDVETLAATSALLRKWGFTVDAYDCWSGALEHDADMLVCDYQLGAGATGLDVVADVRSMSGRTVPALIITGTDPQRLNGRARAAGLPVLTKPVGPAQLRSAVLAALATEA